jgi:hypothetical protein
MKVQQKLQDTVERYKYSSVKSGSFLTTMVSTSIKTLLIMFKFLKCPGIKAQ